jgi:uncharacterized membrane protein YhhN
MASPLWFAAECSRLRVSPGCPCLYSRAVKNSLLLRVWPLAVLLSAALAVAGAPFALDQAWLVFVFKPLTTVLIIGWAWRRGADSPVMRRWVVVGLVLSLVGDVALLWPKQGFLPGLIAFLLAHLAYIRAFCVPARLGAKPLPFVLYALVAALLLSQLWPGVPGALRVPVLAYVLCLASMAAQAAVWWRVASGEHRALAGRAALGGLLFMLSDTLLAFNKFAVPLPLSALWILASYWLAQWCIANALKAPTPTFL